MFIGRLKFQICVPLWNLQHSSRVFNDQCDRSLLSFILDLFFEKKKAINEEIIKSKKKKTFVVLTEVMLL